MAQTAYHSARPAQKSLRDHGKEIMQILAAVAVVGLAVVAAPVLPTLLVVVTVAAAVAFAGYRGYQINQALLPEVMGADPYRNASIETELPPPVEPEPYTTEVIVEEAKIPWREDPDAVVFRNHMLDYFRGSSKLWKFVIPVLLFAMMPVVLLSLGDQREVMGILVRILLVSGAITLAGMLPAESNLVIGLLLWPFRLVKRFATAVTIAGIACFVAVQVPSLATAMVSGLLLAALLPVLRRWAVWYSRRYVVTREKYIIATKALWIFWINNGERSIDLKIIRLTSHDTPPYALALGAGETAGRVKVETNLQEDDPFSKNPHLIKYYKEMEDVINERRELLQAA